MKVFPPDVVALDDVSVDLRSGEVHAIVGENGAGKSTLMKILYGIHQPDAGRIRHLGREVRYSGPRDAITAGIGMVHQEILLVDEFTVWENVALGNEPVNVWGRVDRERARRDVAASIEVFELGIDGDALAGDLTVARRQQVEILKLLHRRVDVLILDEPTTVLAPGEVDELFEELDILRKGGRTIVFISHHLDEVLEIADRITVMRKGRLAGEVARGEATQESLARMMVGRNVVFTTERTPVDKGEVVLSVVGVSAEGLDDASLSVSAGEVVGVAGVTGNGQGPFVECIVGLRPTTAGEIGIGGQDVAGVDILDRRRLLSYVPEDRRRAGAAVTSSIAENAIMTHHRLDPTLSTGRLLDRGRMRELTETIRSGFSVVMSSPDAEFGSMSGGNQQKVILGRELSLDTDLVLLDQPTRGMDVGSIEYVHGLVDRLRSEGRAVLMVSADLEELFRVSDRIVVFHRGGIVADLVTTETDITEVGLAMLGGASA